MTGEKRMKGAEVLAEVEWFLDAGVHPQLIAQELGRTAMSLEILARRWKNVRVQKVFMAASQTERVMRAA